MTLSQILSVLVKQNELCTKDEWLIIKYIRIHKRIDNTWLGTSK